MFLKKNPINNNNEVLTHTIIFVFIGLILGTAIANFFILVSIIIFFLIDKNNYRLLFYKYEYIDKILLFFFLFLIFSSLFSEYTSHSFYKSLLYFKFFLIFIILKVLILQSTKFFPLIWKLFLPIFLILIFDSIFQYLFAFNIIGIERTSSRISSFFGDEWILGSYLFHTIPFILTALYLQNYKNFKKNIFCISISILTILIIYISGERTTFFLSVVYFLIILFLIFIRKIYFLFIFIIFLSSLVIIFPSNRMFNTYQFQIQNDPNIYSTFSVYKDLYSTAFKMHQDKKFFGHGFQTFRKICPDKKFQTGRFGCSTHPHNYYFQILAENGIIGLIIFLSIIILLLKDLIQIFIKWKNKFEESYLILLFIILNILIPLIPLVPSGNAYSSVSGIFLYFKLALYFALKKKFN